jgi:hypothetical protein
VAAEAWGPAVRLGPLGRLADLPSQLLEDGVAGQTGDITACGGRCEPLPHLGRGTVALAAKEQAGVGPGGPPPLAPALHSRPPRCAWEALGLEARREQAPREALLKRKRPKARATLRAIVAGLCLLPMDAFRSHE